MKTPQPIKNLLNKPMDRQTFLKHLGIGTMFLLGAGTIVQSLTGIGRPDHSKTLAYQSPAILGYGTSAYGGARLERN